MFSRDLDGSTVCCEREQAMNSGECSEMVFNNGYYVDTSSVMGNTLQVTIQPSSNMEKQSIYYYFSATMEVSLLGLGHC